MTKKKVATEKLYGIDIETHDPHLKDKGESWIWNEGEIIVGSVFDESKNKTYLYKGKQLSKYKELFADPDGVLIGANINYDILWICHLLKIKVTNIKARLIDVQITEGLIDPFAKYSLDDLSLKYLKEGKGSERLLLLQKKHKLTGDFRRNIKKFIELGYEDEVDEYVRSDAHQPVLIHKKQMELIEKLNCMEAFDIYQKNNLVAMQMKQNGIRIDYEKWKENSEKLAVVSNKLEKEFIKKYGDVNINSPAQVGVMFKENGFDVKFKITVRGYLPKGGQKFQKKFHGFTKEQRKTSYEKLQSIVPVFTLEKNVLFMECKSDKVEAMTRSLNKLGYECVSGPMTSKTVLRSADAQVVTDYLLLKQIREIQKKFLGEKFSRYFSFKKLKNGKTECRIHTSFLTIGARSTARYSSVKPNLQNIPARVILWENTKKQINVSAMCREVFLPEEGHILVRLDYSGQENRWMAYFGMGDEGEFIRAKYREDPDFDEHDFVVENSGLLQDHAASIARKYAKNIRFATAYGASYKRIAKDNNWTASKARDIVQKILNASPWFSITKEHLIKSLSTGKIQGIRTALNRFIVCPSKDVAYKFYNYLIQGSGADQMKAAMVHCYEFIKKKNLMNKIIPVLTIHDELCYSVDPSAIKYVRDIRHLMENAIPVDVPFICEPEAGPNWAYTEAMTERKFKEIEENYDEE